MTDLKIGIDKIGFYTPEFYLDLTELAKRRNVDPNKFKIGIGQDEQAVAPLDQDVVTMAANAAVEILSADDLATINEIIFATESGIDQSKAAALYVQRLLGINHHARAFEVKEACYGATAALQTAYEHLATHPSSQKVLVLGSDVARYGLATGGEVTQGAGAVALLITRNPRILALEQSTAYFSEDIMDFWRPNYSVTAFAEGKYSTEQYLRFLDIVWQDYQQQTKRTLSDQQALLFHIPYTKLGLKGLRQTTAAAPAEQQEALLKQFTAATIYNRKVGNIYTGSLYLSLLSLLQNSQLTAGSRIGLFSYGSGAVGEFFSGILQPDYQAVSQQVDVVAMLANRQKLSVDEYETVFQQALPTDGSHYDVSLVSKQAQFHLLGIDGHQRLYK